MAQSLSENFQLLEKAVLQLINENKKLKQEIAALKDELSKLTDEDSTLTQIHDKANRNTDVLKVAGIQMLHAPSIKVQNSHLKEKINVCIKEIERCIAQMND